MLRVSYHTFLHLLRLSSTLRGGDYTCINYPLNFLSPGGGGEGGESATFSIFQKMYLKQAKGPAKQWCSIKHHGVNITNFTPTPSLLNGLDGSLLLWTRKVFKTSRRACTARAYLNWRDVKQQERNITTPPPPPP